MTINHWQQRQKSIESGDVELRDALALSQSRKATAKSHSILWITAGVRRSATLMLMRGVTELFNKRRLNSAARYTAAAYGLLMHYSSANAATCTVVARRCCALTWPKLRRHQGGQKRSKPTWMLTPRIRVHPCSRETCMDAETSPSRFELLRGGEGYLCNLLGFTSIMLYDGLGLYANNKRVLDKILLYVELLSNCLYKSIRIYKNCVNNRMSL